MKLRSKYFLAFAAVATSACLAIGIVQAVAEYRDNVAHAGELQRAAERPQQLVPQLGTVGRRGGGRRRHRAASPKSLARGDERGALRSRGALTMEAAGRRCGIVTLSPGGRPAARGEVPRPVAAVGT